MTIIATSSVTSYQFILKDSTTAFLIIFRDHNFYKGEFNWRIAGIYSYTEKIYSKLFFGTSF